MIITKTLYLEVECQVKVELSPSEKGCGECPNYPATCVVDSVYAACEDITPAFSEDYLNELANEIAEDLKREGDEARLEHALSMRDNHEQH